MLAELLLAAVVDTAPEGELPHLDTRCVVVGSGSIEVPGKYRVLRSPNGVDSVSGRFEAEDGKQKIYWQEYDPGYVVPGQRYLFAFRGAPPGACQRL